MHSISTFPVRHGGSGEADPGFAAVAGHSRRWRATKIDYLTTSFVSAARCTGLPKPTRRLISKARAVARSGRVSPAASQNGGGGVAPEPNPLVAPIHPTALPFLLHPEDGAKWRERSHEDAIALAQPLPWLWR